MKYSLGYNFIKVATEKLRLYIQDLVAKNEKCKMSINGMVVAFAEIFDVKKNKMAHLGFE